jgi:hypothetical protein
MAFTDMFGCFPGVPQSGLKLPLPKSRVKKPASIIPVSPPDVQATVRDAAQRIHNALKKSLTALVALGADLKIVRKSLTRGGDKFEKWVDAEFGWSKKTAERKMRVAAWLGKFWDNLSLIRIDTSAAYLLAAHSTPELAREIALLRARAGERITLAIAKEILAEASEEDEAAVSAAKLRRRLAKVLVSYRERWPAAEIRTMATQLRQCAESIEELE